MIFLGVDPGFSGALAVLTDEGGLLQVLDVPTIRIGGRVEYDRQELKRILRTLVGPWVRRSGGTPLGGGSERLTKGPTSIAGVELVHAMPGQGVVSMWRMGQGYELWMMALTMLDVPVESVTPQKWKAVMLDGLPKDKASSRHRARSLWPNRADLFARVKDDGRADACLIAEYLRRQWVKQPGPGEDETPP